jgi:hypothetical protein
MTITYRFPIYDYKNSIPHQVLYPSLIHIEIGTQITLYCVPN